MAKLLVRTVDGENALRYMRGDVVVVVPDDHVFGRMESFEVWVGEGRNPGQWPGGFAVVNLPGLTVEAAQQYLDYIPLAGSVVPVMHTRRRYSLDLDGLERRSPSSGRDTLRTEHRITRQWGEVADLMRSKG